MCLHQVNVILKSQKSNAKYSVIVGVFWVLENKCSFSKLGWGLGRQTICPCSCTIYFIGGEMEDKF